MGKEVRGQGERADAGNLQEGTKSLNALLAEILGKMGRSRVKLRDFIPPQVAATPIRLGEQLLAHWY